ncbi:hypothetical protein EYC56_17390 [Xanthomonas oryzae]|nr:hypothetical protein EYC56_17390 [Xanthomonas oryzae]
MICSSEKRFFTSNLLGVGNWTPNRCATQTRGDVESIRRTPPWCVRSRLSISAPTHDRCLATSFCTDPSEVAPCEGDAHPGLLRPR